MRTWIKICATTCIEDALASIEAGADALGFVFAPSKRQVSIEQAARIARQLPAAVQRVGVFSNDSASHIALAIGEAGLTAVQLHGDESPELIAELAGEWPRGRPARIIKTVLVNENFEMRFAEVCRDYDGIEGILLDSGGGSGHTFDWHRAQSLLADSHKRLIVAGGLRPENVGKAIKRFSPWGVDVVSGVEREPGRKDTEKLKAFVAAVRKAEQG